MSGWHRWSRSKTRTHSLSHLPGSLEAMSQYPGTEDRPKYVHVDNIKIEGFNTTLTVGNTIYMCSDENGLSTVPIENKKKKRGENPTSYFYFDVTEKGTGKRLRLWVTENEMLEALKG